MRERIVWDPDGSIRAVLVAEWADLQVWRVLHGNRQIRLEMWSPSDPLSMSEALSTIGNTDRLFFTGPPLHPPPYILSFVSLSDACHYEKDRRVIDQLRWLLHHLGVLDWYQPVCARFSPSHDPAIAWFRDLNASKAVAVDLDRRMCHDRMRLDRVHLFDHDAKEWSKLILEPEPFRVDISWDPWRNFKFSSTLSVALWDGSSTQERMPDQDSFSSFLDFLSSPGLESPGRTLIFSDQQKAREWFESRLVPGQLSISEEEVEMFQLLGEPLPYLWSEEDLSSWAMSLTS